MRFIERTIANLSQALERADSAGDLAHADGLLQGLDARVKLGGLLALILAVVATRNLLVMLGIFFLAVALGFASRVSFRVGFRLWLGVLLFSGTIALPAIFLTPGLVICQLPIMGWAITQSGVRTALQLLVRTETAATLAALLVLCTPWTQVLKALRAFRVPSLFVLMLGMTHRYILLYCRTAQDLFEARRSRLIRPLDGPGQRRLAAANGGVLLSKSLHLGGEVYLAMQSRGFRGEARTIEAFRMQERDWVALGGFTLAAILAVLIRPQ